MELIGDLRLVQIFVQEAADRDAARKDADSFAVGQESRVRQRSNEKREQREREEREHFEEFLAATAAEVAAFRQELDTYDTATVQALMDNGQALDETRHARERMEASAYRLPDGRLVFKSDDGRHVFDQRGEELSRDTIEPGTIPDTGPRWTAFKNLTDTESKLVQDRQHLHQFQQRLDDARETVSKGGMTADALAKMDAALQRDMPMGIKERLPGATAELDALSAQRTPQPGAHKALPYAGQALNGP